MAGLGKRMRPHTLSVPKPLIPIAGVPVVERLAYDISQVVAEPIEEIAFIIGNFGEEVEQSLHKIANSLGAKASIYYQHEALGTGHAIYCAKESLKGNVVVAFADTLFIANFKLDNTADGTIWVHKVKNPSAYGVVKLDNENIITEFIEKPQEFISDLAIIGIYYFKDGENLKAELKYLIDNNITVKGEYQLTDALENMKAKGMKFTIGKVNEWLDCGNKEATIFTNRRILEHIPNKDLIAATAQINGSVIFDPCFIANNVVIENAVIGPYVSVGEKTEIRNCIISNSIIQKNSNLQNLIIKDSMIGNNVEFKGKTNIVNIGDFTQVEL